MNGRASVVGSGDGQRVVDRCRPRRDWPFWPTPLVRLPCGSTSTSRTRWSASASEAARLMVGGGLADAALLVGDGDDTRPCYWSYMPIILRVFVTQSVSEDTRSAVRVNAVNALIVPRGTLGDGRSLRSLAAATVAQRSALDDRLEIHGRICRRSSWTAEAGTAARRASSRRRPIVEQASASARTARTVTQIAGRRAVRRSATAPRTARSRPSVPSSPSARTASRRNAAFRSCDSTIVRWSRGRDELQRNRRRAASRSEVEPALRGSSGT